MVADLAAPLVHSDLADSSTRGAIGAMLGRLDAVRDGNLLKERYYDYEAHIPKSKVLPAAWQEAKQIVGWPSTVVDVLEERLNLLGWRGDESGTLSAFYDEGGIALESSLAHLDALIFGVSFVFVDPHAVADGRPDLVTAESPLNVTGVWDTNRRSLGQALVVTGRDKDSGEPTRVVWADAEETGELVRAAGVWRWVERRPHQLGRTPVVNLVNRPRGSRLAGRSEISLPVRSYTVQGVQTLAGMSTNRDIYSYPQRYAQNAPEDMFLDEGGNPIPGWQTAMAAMLASDPPEPGVQGVEFGSFQTNPPTPFLDQISGLAIQLAGEAAIPPHFLGLLTDNPASAEAIKNIETRLTTRTERRQTSFGRGWRLVGQLLLAARGLSTTGINSHWQPADTPTVAAEADAVSKLVAAGVLPPRGRVVLDRLRFDPSEQRRIREDWVAEGPSPVAALAAAVAKQGVDRGDSD